MFCEHCGLQLPDNARFCTSCGMQTRTAPPACDVPVPPVRPAPPHIAQEPIAVTPSAAGPRKKALRIGIVAGGALLIAAAIFFGIRLHGNATGGSLFSEPVQEEAHASAEKPTMPALPAYNIPTQQPSQPPLNQPLAESTAAAINEEQAVLGTWLGAPDEDGWCALMHIGEGMLGEGFAIAQIEGEAGIENYPEGFVIRAFTWSEWKLSDGAFLRVWEDGEKDSFAYSLPSQDLLELETDFETVTYQRIPAQQDIPLIDFLSGSWVSQARDENGYRLAAQFDMEGTSDCEFFLVKAADGAVVYGDWHTNDWEYGDRHKGVFTIAGNDVNVTFPSGTAKDRTYAVEMVDAWRVILARDGYRTVLHRMDWLAEQ